MIHLTPADRLDSILSLGLLTGREPELTSDAVWTIPYYGTNPVFLAEPGAAIVVAMREDADKGYVTVEVDVSGLELVADLASLADHGGRHDEDGYLYWPPRRIPDAMRPYLDHDGAIEIEHLLDPATDACRAAIRLTGTAACMEPVGTERLRAVEEPAPGPRP
jgi:hypothetical protein